jgi:hypothetical protein
MHNDLVVNAVWPMTYETRHLVSPILPKLKLTVNLHTRFICVCLLKQGLPDYCANFLSLFLFILKQIWVAIIFPVPLPSSFQKNYVLNFNIKYCEDSAILSNGGRDSFVYRTCRITIGKLIHQRDDVFYLRKEIRSNEHFIMWTRFHFWISKSLTVILAEFCCVKHGINNSHMRKR